MKRTMTNTLLTLHDPPAAVRYHAQGLWRDETLYALLAKHAAARPNDYALRDGATRLPWRWLHRTHHGQPWILLQSSQSGAKCAPRMRLIQVISRRPNP